MRLAAAREDPLRGTVSVEKAAFKGFDDWYPICQRGSLLNPSLMGLDGPVGPAYTVSLKKVYPTLDLRRLRELIPAARGSRDT